MVQIEHVALLKLNVFVNVVDIHTNLIDIIFRLHEFPIYLYTFIQND